MPTKKHGEEESPMASSQRMMKACVLRTKGNVQMEDMPVPTPGHNELLVKMQTSGLCHTDLHMVHGDLDEYNKALGKKRRPQLILGHEGVGKITQLGEGVIEEGLEFKVGDRVGIPWLGKSCRNCEMCISGHENMCPKIRNTGCNVNGTYAEYCVVNAANAVRIPDKLSSKMASPLLCAGTTAFSALKRSKLHAGQFVAILGGAGGVGHLAIQFARAMGLKVISFDLSDDKVKFSKSVGAHHAFNCKNPDVWAHVMELTGGGVHGVIVVAPDTKAYTNAFKIIRPGGVIVCVAVSDNTSLPINEIVYKQIRIKGSLEGTRQDCKEALQFAAEGKVTCHLTEKPLSQGPEILKGAELSKFPGRVVLDCSGKGFLEEKEQGPMEGLLSSMEGLLS